MNTAADDQHPPKEHHWTAGTLALFILLVALGVVLVQNAWLPKDVYLDSLPYEVLASGDQEPVNNQNRNGETLQIHTTYYPVGVAVQADTTIELRSIPPNQRYFVAEIGLDGQLIAGSPAAVVFTVIADGTVLYESPVMTHGMRPRQIHVPVAGRQVLTLEVTSPDDSTQDDHAIWAVARFSSK